MKKKVALERIDKRNMQEYLSTPDLKGVENNEKIYLLTTDESEKPLDSMLKVEIAMYRCDRTGFFK